MSKQVTVFGANGKVGSLVVAELLARQYTVVAFVHGGSRFPDDPHLKVVQGDIYDPQAVDQALADSDVVVSTLGSWGTPKKDILTVGMTNTIAAMTRRNISRIISLTGAESRATGDRMGLIHRLMHLALHIAASKVLADGERHIELLEKSGLEWTVIRSPIMTSQTANSADYQLSDTRPLPWQLIRRESVVLAIVTAVESTDWYMQAPYINGTSKIN